MLLPVKADLLSLFCCPVGRSESLQLKATETEDGEVVSGCIHCDDCGRDYPIRGGIAHLVADGALPTEGWQRNESGRLVTETRRDTTRPCRQRDTAIELDAIVSALRPTSDENVLDLGAGTGRLTAALASAGATVVAIDLSPKSLQLNRMKCLQEGFSARVCHVVADACRLPLRESTVDKGRKRHAPRAHINPHEERKRCWEDPSRAPDGRASSHDRLQLFMEPAPASRPEGGVARGGPVLLSL